MVTNWLQKVNLLPLMFDKKLGRDNSLVIIVVLRVSLMVDQVHNFRSRSVKALVMSSGRSEEKLLLMMILLVIAFCSVLLRH